MTLVLVSSQHFQASHLRRLMLIFTCLSLLFFLFKSNLAVDLVVDWLLLGVLGMGHALCCCGQH